MFEKMKSCLLQATKILQRTTPDVSSAVVSFSKQNWKSSCACCSASVKNLQRRRQGRFKHHDAERRASAGFLHCVSCNCSQCTRNSSCFVCVVFVFPKSPTDRRHVFVLLEDENSCKKRKEFVQWRKNARLFVAHYIPKKQQHRESMDRRVPNPTLLYKLVRKHLMWRSARRL
jgi:hypothetical protein